MNLSQSAKCEALVRVEEVETRERSLEHRERRLEEERSLMQGQVSLLQVTRLIARTDILHIVENSPLLLKPWRSVAISC